MTAQQLKNSILQLAIQGKLVPQDPNDEPASVLLERIRQEKENLVKQGKIKRDKKPSVIFRGADNITYEKTGLVTRAIDDELPFEIPESWEWIRLYDVTFSVGTKVNQILAKHIKPEGKIAVVSQGKNIIEGFCNDETKQIRDIPLVMFGDHTKNVKYIDFPFVIGADGTKIHKVICCSPKYIYYWMSFIATQLRDRGYARHYTLLVENYVPIPPLAEQRRIVSKIESLLPLVESYGKRQVELDDLNATFPEALKKSILQEAIQGRLVEQDPNDEPASVLLERIREEKERLIKLGKIKRDKKESVIYRRGNSLYEKQGLDERCIDDELPFEIPENWAWARLGEVSSLITKGTTPRGGNVVYLDHGIAFLRAENVAGFDSLETKNLKYIDECTHLGELRRSIIEVEDILITIAGTLGRTALVKKSDLPLNANQAVSIVRFVNKGAIDLKYVIFALNAPVIQEYLTEQKKITAIPNLTLEIISHCILPIPPLSEQIRIVSKIEILLPHLKALE